MANSSPNTVVYTGTTGPGQSVTSLTFTDVSDIEFDFRANTIKVTHGIGISYFDYSAITTLTWSISSGHATITIS